MNCSSAVVTLLSGGEANVVQKVPLSALASLSAQQRLQIAGPGIAFRVTATTEAVESYEHQLRALLKLTPLDAIHWINLAHHNIQFVTISR